MTVPLAPPWRDYRHRLAAVIVGLAGLVAWADGVDVPLGRLLPDGALHALAAAWLTAVAGALGWLAAFRCPFCGEHFHWTVWVANPIARRCLHCGFEKWRDPAAGKAFTRQ